MPPTYLRHMWTFIAKSIICPRYWPPACLRSWAEYNFAGKPTVVCGCRRWKHFIWTSSADATHSRKTIRSILKVEWLKMAPIRPANIKGANKGAKIYVGRSTTLHNLLFCAYTLCMNYVTNTYLLVSSPVRSKQQAIAFCAGSKPKNRTITWQQRTLSSFITIIPLLTMAKRAKE